MLTIERKSQCSRARTIRFVSSCSLVGCGLSRYLIAVSLVEDEPHCPFIMLASPLVSKRDKKHKRSTSKGSNAAAASVVPAGAAAAATVPQQQQLSDPEQQRQQALEVDRGGNSFALPSKHIIINDISVSPSHHRPTDHIVSAARA